MDRKKLINATLAAIRDARRSLEVERDTIEDQIKEKDALIQAWVEEIEMLERPANETRTTGTKRRRPRGEPLHKINGFFEGDAKAQTEGATTKEIADTTGLPWSTVRNVLEKPKNGFVKDDTERWKRVQPIKLKAA